MAADLLNERLPQDWSYGVTGDGRVFFTNERYQETSWLHPVTGRPVQTGHQAAPGLPNGWEQDYTPEGVTYFIDHNNRQTSFGHPVTGRPVSEENPPPPPSSPPQSPTDREDFTRGTTSAKQRSIKAPSAKRNPNSQVVRRGFLYRLETGGISKTWKRRWCVLADFALFIYKSDDEKVTLGSVLLPSYRINRCTSDDPVQKEFAFKVEHENTKTIYFHTDTQTDLDSWLSNLQMAATMKGTGGFYREANNNNKGGGGPMPRSPYSGDQRRSYADGSQQPSPGSAHNFHPQWKNPNPDNHSPRSSHSPHSPGRGPTQNSAAGPPSWRSVPDLERDGGRGDPRGPQGGPEPDPHSSLRSLSRDGPQHPGFPGQGLQPDSRNFPHHQSYDPRLMRPRAAVEEGQDPRGSVRSLQPDPYKNAQGFVPLGQSRAAERDRGSYTQPGFQPYQRPHDPHQRSSMVSDPGRRAGGQGSPQRSPRDANTSQGSMDGAYQDGTRNRSFLHDPNRPGNEGGVVAHSRERISWQAPQQQADPAGYPPQHRNSMGISDNGRGHPDDSGRGYPDPDSRGYPDPGKGYPNPGRGYPDPGKGYPDHGRGYPDPGKGYPDPGRDPDRGYPERPPPGVNQEPGRDPGGRPPYPDSNPRLNTSRDPRASYASSRHSVASQGHREDLGSKQNLYPPHGSRNSLSRLPPPSSSSYPPPHTSPHDPHGHTYVNVPEMRSAVQQFEQSPPPERPPYPSAVRDHLVMDIAETRSPGTAEKLLMAHELNKERMQRAPFFQYPTPPRENGGSRVSLAHRGLCVSHCVYVEDAANPEAVKRLSQYSDRNSLASTSAMRNELPPTSTSTSTAAPPHHPPRGGGPPARDYSDLGRRQDSGGSSRFSDSLEQQRRSAEGPRDSVNAAVVNPGMGNRGSVVGEGVVREEAPVPEERRFGGDPEAKSLRQAYERVQSFRQSSAAG
ncbi:hypothetical protein ACOMHN_016110 [Nucella lapillus]